MNIHRHEPGRPVGLVCILERVASALEHAHNERPRRTARNRKPAIAGLRKEKHMKPTTSLPAIVADAAPDARGFITLRIADGTEHGDTNTCCVATVYSDHAAAYLVHTANAYQNLVSALETVLKTCSAKNESDTDFAAVKRLTASEIGALLTEVRYAIAKANGDA